MKRDPVVIKKRMHAFLRQRACGFCLAGMLLGAACTSSSGPPEESPEPGEPESSEQDATSSAIWEYLSEKYDLNQDGVVNEFEYQQEGAELRTLDNNADGELTAADFLEASIHSSFDRSRRAQINLVEYFQDDDQPYDLTREECRRSAEAYDRDRDGKLSKVEFRELSPARHLNLLAPNWLEAEPNVLPRLPWLELRLAIDTDRDRALSMAELDRFFMDNASGREVWNVERYIGFPLPPGFVSLSGPRLGEPAPDFTLQPTDGGASVSLSSFRDERPVALIFGSYT